MHFVFWILVSVGLAAEPAGAADPPSEPRGARWDLSGEARVRFDAVTPFRLDRAGTQTERHLWLSTGLRVAAGFELADGVDLNLGLEAFVGQVAGEWTGVGLAATERPFRVSRASATELQWVLPRRLNVTVSRPSGRFAAGVQGSHVGLGMLAHDGDHASPFGDARQGNVVARVGGALTPWRPNPDAGLARGVAFVLAADFVLRDDAASVILGDLAFAGTAGVRLQAPRGGFGLVVSPRYQLDREDPWHVAAARPHLFAVPIDATGSWRFGAEGSPVHVTLAGEGAVVLGRTNRPYGEETTEGAELLTLGGLLRGSVDVHPARLTITADLGYASGDSDPRDGVARTFAMHSDHNVGLLLFEELLPRLTARSADRVADPELSGLPAAGLRHGIAQGGVSNAVYLHPTLRVRPVSTLDVRVGWVLAFAAAPVVDLYETALNGGYNASWGGAEAGGSLYGNEVDLAVACTIPIPGRLALRLGAEAALLVPGDVFDGLELGTLGTVRGHLDLRW